MYSFIKVSEFFNAVDSLGNNITRLFAHWIVLTKHKGGILNTLFNNHQDILTTSTFQLTVCIWFASPRLSFKYDDHITY